MAHGLHVLEEDVDGHGDPQCFGGVKNFLEKSQGH